MKAMCCAANIPTVKCAAGLTALKQKLKKTKIDCQKKA